MFAVFLLRNFRLQSALRFRKALQREAVVIVEENVVIEASDDALRNGVILGQSSSQALARCAKLILLPPALSAEEICQSILLETALCFSPEVEATAEGYCTLNLERSRSRDWSAIASQAVEQLKAFGLSAQVGIAANPDLAFLAANHADPSLVVQTPHSFLRALAVHELDPSPQLLSLLKDWGIHNLQQLTSLPRGELMNRLGTEASRLWERAAGITTRPLRLIREQENYVESCDFEHEIETVEPLLFLLRKFLDQLTLRLSQSYRAAGQLTLTLPLREGSYERSFTVPSPTANADILFRILETHLESLRLEEPAVGVRLHIGAAHHERQQFQLFESALRDPNRFGETLGRLAALVGSENVGVPELRNTHRADSFRLNLPRFEKLESSIRNGPVSALGMPLRRYRPAIAASVKMIHHNPVSITSSSVTGCIVESCGPYRVSGEWWEQGWRSEEWDVAVEDRGLYRILRSGENWQIEGCYEERQRRKGGDNIVSLPSGR